ncbi:MAG: hypothetical protein KIT31_01915 [Deltaproteobacteria bacterium]|nr:hypothetical protein [Deltaproteobacteria bacterium]
MALAEATLLERLRRFSDVDHVQFSGEPTTEDDARHRWAAAFADYVSAIAPSVGTAFVAQAFHDTLQLGNAMVAQPPESDFAAAWSAGMTAITGIAGGGWDFAMLAVRETALRAVLGGLFAAPTANTSARLSAIAGAFHVATTGMKSATNVVYS